MTLACLPFPAETHWSELRPPPHVRRHTHGAAVFRHGRRRPLTVVGPLFGLKAYGTMSPITEWTTLTGAAAAQSNVFAVREFECAADMIGNPHGPGHDQRSIPPAANDNIVTIITHDLTSRMPADRIPRRISSATGRRTTFHFPEATR